MTKRPAHNKLHAFLFLFCVLTAVTPLQAEAPIEVYFSPKDHCDQKLIQQINSAKKSLDIAIYSLSKENIAAAVASANARGVRVRIVTDKQQAGGKYSKDEYLRAHGITVLEDTHAGLMHDKFAVIDDRIVITGSYNWTNGATYKNDENMVIIRTPEIVARFEQEFTRLLEENK